MDGEITIGTKLDTDKFDRQISQLEKKMKKEEDKKIIIDAKLGSQQQELDKARQKTDALAEAYQRLKEAQNKVETGQATPKEFATFQDLQSTYGSLEQLGASFDKALTKQDAIEQKVAQTKFRYDEINAKVSEYKQKIENVKIEKQVADVEKLKSGFNSVGSSIQGAVKHVARLALGIFGIRSAFMFLRRASSDLASYDQQYATNLEYIRYALTQMIAPVLQWIVNLAAKLLGYINAIMQAWFGINLFSRGSAKNFQKMKAGASGVSKAVKEIKKQLAGFDEINMLTDQSDSGAGGGGGAGGVAPDFDLSKFQGEVPDWLQWIIDHKDEILAIMAGVATGLLAWKLGLDAIKSLGLGLLIAGIVLTIEGLIKYLKDPSWKNFGKIIQGVGLAILGLGVLIESVPLIVAGAIVLIVGTIVKYWDKIEAFLQKGIDWLTGKSDWVHKMFGDTIGNIYDLFIDNLQQILNFFDSFFKMIKGIFDGIINFIKGVFTGNWQMAWEGIKQIFSSLWEGIKGIAISIINIIKNNISAGAEVIKAILQTLWNIMKSGAITAVNIVSNVFNSLWNAIKNGAQYAWDFIRNVFSGIGSFFSNIVNRIVGLFGNLGSSAGEAIAGAFKAVVNGVLRAVERILNSPIRAINNLIGVINAVPGVNINRLPTFSLPRLKTGAIVNMPNRGTLVAGGRAIAGEAGHEGIIPLDDNQAMAQLGAEIGRNVTVNLTNITKVGNRQIAREIKQINAEQEFAFNS